MVADVTKVFASQSRGEPWYSSAWFSSTVSWMLSHVKGCRFLKHSVYNFLLSPSLLPNDLFLFPFTHPCKRLQEEKSGRLVGPSETIIKSPSQAHTQKLKLDTSSLGDGSERLMGCWGWSLLQVNQVFCLTVKWKVTFNCQYHWAKNILF